MDIVNKLKFILPIMAVFAIASCASSLGLSSVESSTSDPVSTISEDPSSLDDSSTSLSESISETTSYSDETSALSSLSSTSSQWPSEPLGDITLLDFYNLNDFHGAVAYEELADEPGINRLATYFDTKKDLNENGTILTASGDMWQGSADSNLTKGRLVTDAMNLLGFDAMAVGNHEFDWGDEAIATNETMADFPFLGANIFDRRTNARAAFALPHTMIERMGVRIGIIGTIGSSLESTITQSVAVNYDFRDIDSYVQTSATELEALGAHLIILLNHNGSVSSAALQYVDLVFNGHAHAYSKELISGKPVLQARSNGRSVARARLQYDYSEDAVSVVSYGIDDYVINQNLAEEPTMAALYAFYYTTEIQAIKDEVIGSATNTFGYADVGGLAVHSMLEYGRTYGARAAIHNTGGIRAEIPAGTVTYGDVYKALPFDNDLIVLNLTGSQLKTWLSRAIYVDGVNKSTYAFDDGGSISNTTVYKIITISYLSENVDSYPHDVASELNTYAFARDLAADQWRTAGSLNPNDF